MSRGHIRKRLTRLDEMVFAQEALDAKLGQARILLALGRPEAVVELLEPLEEEHAERVGLFLEASRKELAEKKR